MGVGPEGKQAGAAPTAPASLPAAVPSPASPSPASKVPPTLTVQTDNGGFATFNSPTEASIVPTPGTDTKKNPVIQLNPDPNRTNEAVLRLTGNVTSSGPVDPQSIARVIKFIKESGKVTTVPPKDAPSLVVFGPDGKQLYVQAGGTWCKSVPSVTGGLGVTGGPGGVGVVGSAGLQNTKGCTKPMPGGLTEQTSQTSATSVLGGFFGSSPNVGMTVSKSSQGSESWGSQPVKSSLHGFSGSASGPLPSAQVSFHSSNSGPSGSNSYSAAVGIDPFGPNARLTLSNYDLNKGGADFQLGLRNLQVAGIQLPLSGALATFRPPNNLVPVTNVPNGTLDLLGTDGRPTATIGAIAGIPGPVPVIPVFIPGPNLVPERRLPLPEETIQALNATDMSRIAESGLSKKTLATFNSIPEALLRGRDGQSLQPSSEKGRSVTITYVPAEAAVHVFPRSAQSDQTALLDNFKKITGTNPRNPDGTLIPQEKLNDAVWSWFKKNNPSIVPPLETAAKSSDPAAAKIAAKQLASLQAVALARIGEPNIPTPDTLRKNFAAEVRAQELRHGPLKPGEASPLPKINRYKPTYADKFELTSSSSGNVTQKDGQTRATTSITVSVKTPDTEARPSTREQKTGIREQSLRELTEITYSQTVAPDPKVPTAVVRGQVYQDARNAEKNTVPDVYKLLASTARQGGDLAGTPLKILERFPPAGIQARGDLTEQRVSLRTASGEVSFVIDAAGITESVDNGQRFAMVPFVRTMRDNNGGPTVDKFVQPVPLGEQQLTPASKQIVATSTLSAALRNWANEQSAISSGK